ncbi:hypothetical protein BDV06DRAFT_177841 [Aspergillus oleicola]
MKSLVIFSLFSMSLALSIPTATNNSNWDSIIPSHPEITVAKAIESATPVPSPEPAVPMLKINHGTFIPTNKSRIQPHHHPLNASYTIALNTQQSSYQIFERYADEFFALGLLLLVPITLGLVELAERFARSLSVEEFPERGREMHRVGSLEKRTEYMLRRKEREMQVEKTRPWWKWSKY